MKLKIIFLVCLFAVNSYAMEKLRVGVLAFATVNWELTTMKLNNSPQESNKIRSLWKFSPNLIW